MSGREPPRSSDADDWFGEPRSGAPTRPVVDAPQAVDPTAEDWLDAEPKTAWLADGDSDGPTVTLGTLIAFGGAALLVLLVAGLAIGGVFSGGGSKGASDTTTTAPTTTQTQPTTTAPAAAALPAPATTLKPGDQGAQVKRLQRALKSLGYAAGAVDGDYGTATQAAVKRFQEASKLTADGVLGPKTLQALKRALLAHG